MRAQGMRKMVRLAVLAGVAALVSGCTEATKQEAPTGLREDRVGQAGGRVYFSYSDARGDDKGPGTYQYPLSFENREGFLDITDFTVTDGGDNVVFTIGCRRPIPRRRNDGSTEAKGWWLNLIDIYVDKDHQRGSGYVRSLPGRNVEFVPESAWEKVVMVTPEASRTVEKLLEERTSDMELVHMRRDVIVPHRAYAEGFTFRVFVPKYDLGTPEPGWGYQVLMLGFNERNLGTGQLQNEDVVKFAQNDLFGGGSDYRGDPNVIDMLAPTAAEQYRILGDHVSKPFTGDDRWAKISCVYREGPAPAVQGFVPPSATADPATARAADSFLRDGAWVAPAQVKAEEKKKKEEEKAVRATAATPPSLASFEGGF